MDLISAKVDASTASKKSGKHVYIIQDAKDDTELIITAKHPGDSSQVFVTYLNGSEVATPEAPSKPEKVAKKAEAKPEPIKTKQNKKVKTTSQSAIGAKSPKAVVKKAVKKVAAKKDRKATTHVDAVKKLVAQGAKKVTLSISKALERSKKALLYRASNGSPLGKYYLADYKDKTKQVEFLVKDR